jgi:hypothetical protein
MDTYYIGCYWTDRKEDADACTDRAVQCLKQLAGCDPALAEVLVVPKSTRKLPYRVPVNFEAIKPLIEGGRNREDVPPRKIIEKLGYSITFVSDYEKREEQWNIRILCGAYPQTKGLLNHCVLELPKRGEALKTLLQSGTMTCLVRAMIAAWDPDWAVVQGRAFRDALTPDASVPGKVLLGWMAYYAGRLGKVPDDLPVHSRTELEQGTLLVLSREPVTPDRPDHIAAAQAVLPGLQRVGLIPA